MLIDSKEKLRDRNERLRSSLVSVKAEQQLAQVVKPKKIKTKAVMSTQTISEQDTQKEVFTKSSRSLFRIMGDVMGMNLGNYSYSQAQFDNIYLVFEQIIQFCKTEDDQELRNNVLNGFLNYVVLFMKSSPLSAGQKSALAHQAFNFRYESLDKKGSLYFNLIILMGSADEAIIYNTLELILIDIADDVVRVFYL
jgi:hypothetical protein